MKKRRYMCHNDSELLNCWLAVGGFSIPFAFKEGYVHIWMKSWSLKIKDRIQIPPDDVKTDAFPWM